MDIFVKELMTERDKLRADLEWANFQLAKAREQGFSVESQPDGCKCYVMGCSGLVIEVENGKGYCRFHLAKFPKER